MPVRDDDLTRALRDVAPQVDTSQAYKRVIGKRARRRTVRRARLGALGLVVALVVVGSAVLLTRDGQSTRVSTPVAPAAKGWAPISLPTDQGYLRGPLTVSYRGSEQLVSVAAYERDGSGAFAFPPSHIVRFDPRTLEVVDRVDLKAEILSVVDAPNDVRFAVTRNPEPDGPVTAGVFLKRIAADGGVTSIDLPPGTEVTGDLARLEAEIALPTTLTTYFYGFDGELLHTNAIDVDSRYRELAPRGFVVAYASESFGRQWLAGEQDGVPAIAIFAPEGHIRVIRFRGGEDTSFAWVADDSVYATSNGQLFRHRVG